jgi:5-methylcytosine-specific restriction endonuclease McrA
MKDITDFPLRLGSLNADPHRSVAARYCNPVTKLDAFDYGTALSYGTAMNSRLIATGSDTEVAAAETPHSAAVSTAQLGQQALRTDVSGMPVEWIDYKEAVRLYYTGQVAYTCGTPLYEVQGGTNAKTGDPSKIEVNSIIATVGHLGHAGAVRGDYIPPLNNETLFRRDNHLCLYCGTRFPAQQLSRDHVRPFFLGGRDTWNNVVTACRRCNNAKAARTPEQAGMQLLAVPFTPTYAEYIYLKGRRVLADQMEYLLAHFPRSSPLHRRLRAQTN